MEAREIPARECARRLKPEPPPGELHRHRAPLAVAGFRDTGCAMRCATLIRRGDQSRQRAELATVADGAPAEDLRGIQPRCIPADPLQLPQPPGLLRGNACGPAPRRVARRQRRAAASSAGRGARIRGRGAAAGPATAAGPSNPRTRVTANRSSDPATVTPCVASRLRMRLMVRVRSLFTARSARARCR